MNPAGLLRRAVDAETAHQIEQGGGAVTDQADEALPGFAAETGDEVGGIGAGQGRDDLPVVASRSAPAEFGRLQHHRVLAGLRRVQGGRQAGEAAADHQHIGLHVALQHRQVRRRRGGGLP